VTTDLEKLKAVKCWPSAMEKHQLRSFLRLCMYYKFIHGFANIVKPLTTLMEEWPV
jgi:hypothetical protein